jgi:DNA polymerase III delta prime subunit
VIGIDILAASSTIAKAQGRAGSLLATLVKNGRLPPSLLFAGPEGSGKELMAVRLAAMINCRSIGSPAGRVASAPDICGDPPCPACAKVRNLEHPDLHLIYPVPYGEWERDLAEVIASRREDFFARGEFGHRARSIGIELVRRVIEALSKFPYEGNRSVVILFEAHLATVEAQNALLKLLEEPPPSAQLILVTEFPDRLLPTILSRCYEVRFEALSPRAVEGFLETFYSIEGEEARRLSVLSQGNLRRGIQFLDERFIGLWKDAAGAMRLVIDRRQKELVGEAVALSGEYTREEVEELLDEATILLSLVIRHREGLATDDERNTLAGALGVERLDPAASRDLPGDIRKLTNAIGSLRRNADVELTLSQVFLDLAGAWY